MEDKEEDGVVTFFVWVVSQFKMESHNGVVNGVNSGGTLVALLCPFTPHFYPAASSGNPSPRGTPQVWIYVKNPFPDTWRGVLDMTKGIALSGFHLVWTIPLVVPAGHDPATP